MFNNMHKYRLEFVLYIQNIPQERIKDHLSDLGEDLEIIDCEGDLAKGRNFKININADDPAIVLDTCAQFGRIKSVKVNEEEGI